MSTDYLDGKSKNISYRPQSGALGGTRLEGAERQGLTDLLRRFYESSVRLMQSLCPEYRDRIRAGFTSFRSVEIEGRESSWRQDDT